MAKFLPTANKTQLANLEALHKALKEGGVTNKFSQAGVMAVSAKESGLVPQNEASWATTEPNSYIRSIFGSRLAGVSDSEIGKLKKDPKQWFDYLYGGDGGNSTGSRYFEALKRSAPKSEGYKYRGRGFNQITFKYLYQQLDPYTKANIVSDPDSVNEIKTATELIVGFFKNLFQNYPKVGRLWNMNNINDAKNLSDAVGAMFHYTAGIGYSKERVVTVVPAGWKKANEYVVEFYDWILKKEGEKPDPEAYKNSPTLANNQSVSDSTKPASNPTDEENQSSTSQDSGSSNTNVGPNIVNIVPAKLKAREISFDLPPQKDQQREIVSNLGKIPFLWYNAYQIRPDNISYLSLTCKGVVPVLKVTFLDTYNLMKDKGFPLDDTKVSVFINTLSEQLKPIHLDFKISKFSVDGKTYNITGVLDVGDLYLKKFKSMSKMTSFKALKTIAEETGMGYNSNIDDTSDEMTWINTGKRLYEFIDHIVESSYKSDESYLLSYIDYFYNLTYVDIEKELNRDLKQDLGVNSMGLDEIAKVKDQEKVRRLFLTNDQSMRDSNNYFKEYKIINNSTRISLEEGYLTKVKFYDQTQKDFLVFDVDSITSEGNQTIILKGGPQDEKFFSENINLIYNGKLDPDNMHKNYLYSSVQNQRNVVDLEKIALEITMGNANYNLIKFQKVHVIISNQHATPSASHLNNRLTGDWFIIDISYIFDGKSYKQKVKLVKRELELSAEESSKEAPRKKTRKSSSSTSNDTGGQQQTQSSSTTGDTESPVTEVAPIEGEPLRQQLENYVKLMHVTVQNRFRSFLRDFEKERPGWKVTPTSSLRGWESSLRIWNTYPEVQRCCKPGRDHHMFGFAFDLVLTSPKGQVANLSPGTKPIWKESGIKEIAARYGLQWGIGFNGYFDPVHFAYPIYNIDQLVGAAIAQYGSLEKTGNRGKDVDVSKLTKQDFAAKAKDYVFR